MGGAVHTAAQIQEKAMPAMANLASNLTLPKGLQTTIHLSQEMIAKDQRPVIPLGQSRQEDFESIVCKIKRENTPHAPQPAYKT